MTDKVQKIRKEVEMVVNRRLNLLNGDYFDLNKEADGFTNEIMYIIDSLQEEPVSNVWHDKSENIKEGARVCVLWNDGIITCGEWKNMDEPTADIKTLKMWACESDILPTDK